ncbi:thiol reductase thioredoxin [Streptococcus gallolyticus]|uniref:thiol reductase thioredoxin n=1 Tax=Streptococcus hepaticus TaxID=3349163 RepID=UPI001C976DB8|nr:thiol reductase thioredoxin [Streptococcus gallolyticus]MBY5042132.1 thiol reductase thioredoxin [Streptococcus gallolyticus]
MFSPQEFLEAVQHFTAVTPSEAQELLLKKEGGLLFIGRESCSFCRRFCQTLLEFFKEEKQEVYFLHSQHPDYSPLEIAELRNQYQVVTVPGLLYAATDGVRVHCDSSMTADQIREFISY